MGALNVRHFPQQNRYVEVGNQPNPVAVTIEVRRRKDCGASWWRNNMRLKRPIAIAQQMEMELEPELATARSNLAVPLKSPAAMESGLLPTA